MRNLATPRLRGTLHRLRLPYALGISSNLTVFRGTPSSPSPARRRPAGRAPTRPQLIDGSRARSRARRRRGVAGARVASHHVAQRHATARGRAHFAALRVTPAHDWRPRQLAPEVWLLFERDLGTTPRIKAYFVLCRRPRRCALGAAGASTLGDRAAVSRTQGRTRARSFRGSLVSRLASSCRAHRPRYTWLQHERRRAGARLPTLPVARAVITEVLTAHFFVTHPHYLETMMKLREIHLRI